MGLEIGQILSQIIAFLIMLWVLKRYAWKPLLTTLDERKKKIQSDIDDIENKKNEVNKLKDEYQGKLSEIDSVAAVKVREAVEQGKLVSMQIQKEAHTQAKEMIAKAQSDMQNEVIKAKEQLKKDIVNLTIEATEKILQSKMDNQKQETLITDFINQVRPL